MSFKGKFGFLEDNQKSFWTLGNSYFDQNISKMKIFSFTSQLKNRFFHKSAQKIIPKESMHKLHDVKTHYKYIGL